MAAWRPLWLGACAFSAMDRCRLTSSSVASIRISLPNLRYCPQMTVSALLNFASFRSVGGSNVESAEIRRSPRI